MALWIVPLNNPLPPPLPKKLRRTAHSTLKAKADSTLGQKGPIKHGRRSTFGGRVSTMVTDPRRQTLLDKADEFRIASGFGLLPHGPRNRETEEGSNVLPQGL